MGKKTPRLDYRQKHEYIALHLFNELRWLLAAATEWYIQHRLELGIVGYDVQVYAMDSAFLHARALFEFFVQPMNDNHYGSNEFLGGGTVLESNSYKNDWRQTLHKFLMHAQDRSRPVPLKSADVEKDLNRMPVDFAHEILRLWGEFERGLGESSDPENLELRELARKKRKEAIEGAQCVANSTIAQHHAEEKHQVLSPIFVFAD